MAAVWPLAAKDCSMAMRHWARMSRMRSVSEKSVSVSTSSTRVAIQAAFSPKAEAPATSTGRMRSRSSTSSWTSQAKPMLPRWAWERVSISAALWRAVSSLPSTLASTAT